MRAPRRYGLAWAMVLSGTIANAAWALDDGPSRPPAKGPAAPASAGTRTDHPNSGPLTVCAVPASMPRTGKAPDGTPQGLDVAVARAIGRELKRPIAFHWCANANCAWHCLPAGRCDVVVGQPSGSAPAGVAAWSVPYSGARFGLVVGDRPEGDRPESDRPESDRPVQSLADLRGRRVGVVAGTVALSEKDHTVVRFRSRKELLDQFQEARLDAAFLDADFAAWYLHERPKRKLHVVEGRAPRQRWNMALAVRPDDSKLLVALNRALARLMESGEIAKIHEPLGVPYRRPFAPEGRARPAETPQTWKRMRERGEMVVGMDPANLPYSSARADRPGIDVEMARALAERLKLKLRIEWLHVESETPIGALIEGRCDLVLGEAVADNAMDDEEPLAGKVWYSRPYYRTGYVLIGRKDGPRVRSLAELKGEKSRQLGAEAGSIADYRLRQRGLFRRLYRNQRAALHSLASGEIDYAYLWANAAWTLRVSPDLVTKLQVVPGFLGEDHWDVAVAMRPGDAELKRRIDAALASCRADGAVARVLGTYQMPDLGASAGAAPERRSANRGRDGKAPNLKTVQRSRRPYDALARVRSAGALVVALDPNNLPFSTAHPEPAGLDHEIAGLLAEQLGVAFRPYWAYSSHESFPAQLASKHRCDVILGVAADDRFGDRVLFSRPYYVARYRMVVRAGDGPPSPQAAIAVEDGTAIQGLAGRSLQRLPSTKAVLSAVAQGKFPAGYAIATRGPWLAHKHWPGKLEFLPASGPIDAFPIRAAVRKTDRALKDAIDRAWDELERSGRLAAVFARWHVPYERPSNAVPGPERAARPVLAHADDKAAHAPANPSNNGAAPTATTNESPSTAPTPASASAPAEAPAPSNANAAAASLALAEGQALFRGLCSGCHGGAGRGGKGPDLTDQRWIHGGTDADIMRTIREGVPNTTMKKMGDSLKPEQMKKLVQYIRSLAHAPAGPEWKPYIAGDPKAGQALFFDAKGKAQCVKCHHVGREGGRIGPALDQIASRRSAEYIMESILEPSKDIAPEFETVAVATKDGQIVTGLRLNESNFSIQLREENGRFHSYRKRDLEEVKSLKKSMMPENLAEMLTVKDLHDLFAYLMTLE